MTTAVLSTLIRPLVEPRLPDWVEPLWFMSKEEALELAPRAEIGWFDFNQPGPMCEVVAAATNLKLWTAHLDTLRAAGKFGAWGASVHSVGGGMRDTGLVDGACDALEAEGFRVVGAHEVDQHFPRRRHYAQHVPADAREHGAVLVPQRDVVGVAHAVGHGPVAVLVAREAAAGLLGERQREARPEEAVERALFLDLLGRRQRPRRRRPPGTARWPPPRGRSLRC